jgi:hypothetical protein
VRFAAALPRWTDSPYAELIVRELLDGLLWLLAVHAQPVLQQHLPAGR